MDNSDKPTQSEETKTSSLSDLSMLKREKTTEQATDDKASADKTESNPVSEDSTNKSVQEKSDATEKGHPIVQKRKPGKPFASKKDRIQKVKRDLIVYISIIVVVLGTLLTVLIMTFVSYHRITKGQIAALGSHTVTEQANIIDDFLLKCGDILESSSITVDYMVKKKAPTEEIFKYLEEQNKVYLENYSFIFTDIYGYIGGKYMDGSGATAENDYIPVDRPWFGKAIEGNGKTVFTSPYEVDKSNSKSIVSISRLLSDRRSVLAMDIQTTKLQDIIDSVGINGYGYGFIIDDIGNVIAYPSEERKMSHYLTIEQIENRGNAALFSRILDRSSIASVHELVINGVDSVVFSKDLSSGWHLIVVVEKNFIFNNTSETIRNVCISAFVFFLVFYLCITSYFNRKSSLMYANELQRRNFSLKARMSDQSNTIVHMQEGMIDGMATLIESRDGNTGMHVKNTKEYVSMIVDFMLEHNMHQEEVNPEYAKNLKISAPLHDVGKIMISDSILNKPGKLTPQEFEIIKTHSAIGGQIIYNILKDCADKALLKIASDVAWYHHEKWNGKGYPKGLKGTQIPLAGRIMAVADVFDALVSKRVYKNPLPMDVAFEILRQDAGSHFDPEIVTIFLKCRAQIENYISTHNIDC